MAWNILHGGGPRRVPEIALAIVEQQPDIVLLSEFRAGRGGALRAVLADHGLTQQLTTADVAGSSVARPASVRGAGGEAVASERSSVPRNGLLLASRWPLAPMHEPVPPRALASRWVVARCAAAGLVIAGVHVPDAEGTARNEALAFVAGAARLLREESVVLAGDFNAGRAGIDGPEGWSQASPWIGAIAAAGFEDAWRLANPGGREGTWRSRTGTALRLDHAYVSASARGRVRSARHAQELLRPGISDHAAVLVTLSD